MCEPMGFVIVMGFGFLLGYVVFVYSKKQK